MHDSNVEMLFSYSLSDFSLGTWKLENGVNKGAALSQIQFDVLANTIGISQYLKDTECGLTSARPSDGWNNCKLNDILKISTCLSIIEETTFIFK
jgi:hypothetical protein